jgi:hypothetical protein
MAVATEQREVSLAGAIPSEKKFFFSFLQKISNFDSNLQSFHSMGIWLFVHASFFIERLKESTGVIIKENDCSMIYLFALIFFRKS